MASGHPTEGELRRLVLGELARDETRVVVRHLLAGCEACRAVTRRLWSLGDPPGERRTGLDLEGGERMNEIEAAQGEIRAAVRDLRSIRLRLLGLVSTLPPSPAETSPLLEVEPADPKTELRAVVECVVNDSLVPAIRDLESVAEAGQG
jgi:hypothetical protein